MTNTDPIPEYIKIDNEHIYLKCTYCGGYALSEDGQYCRSEATIHIEDELGGVERDICPKCIIKALDKILEYKP